MSSTFSQFLQLVTPVTVVVGGILLALNQFKNNSSKVASEVITNYKEQVAQLKEENKGIHESLKIHESMIVKLETAGREKDKQIKSYEAIIANRNPDLEKILSSLNSGLASIVSFMEKMEGRMAFAETELKKQTLLLKQ